MCGIVGAVTNNHNKLPSPEIADRMCKVIEHRGPDDQGIYYEEGVFIGMRRLSIIDLESGHQPIHNEDKTIWTVFNGEIYNFRELRKELERKGHKFYTHSDAECIVHSYEEYGEQCFSKFRGMFAIAIWDERKKCLILGRDHLGKKPLFYTYTNGLLAFGSELKSLIQLPGFNKTLSQSAIHDYLLFGYIPTPSSIFKDVQKLPPAHYLIFDLKEIVIKKFWELSFEPKITGSCESLTEQLEDKLSESVRLRLVSDVPFGAFLSGGIDSSIVVSLMAKEMNMPVKTFSIGFKEEEFSELSDARIVASHIGAEHHEEVVEADAVSILDELVWYFDEPFADSSAIPTYLVSKMAAQHVKMVLSGDGGDEAFGGYDRYQKYRVIDRLRKLGGNNVSKALKGAAHFFPHDIKSRVAWLSQRVAQPYPDNYLSGVAICTPDLAYELISNSSIDRGYGALGNIFNKHTQSNPLDSIIAGDIKSYLLDDILVKVDRMSMATSLEARAPLLDYQLMEFAASLPVEYKINKKVTKFLLKKVSEKYLPQSILTKKKQGFGIPLAAWFRTTLKDMMFDIIESQRFRERGIFDVEMTRSILEKHVNKEKDFSEQLWSILVFELWARAYEV